MSQLQSVWTLQRQQLTHTHLGNTSPSTMSAAGKREPPPYVIPVQSQEGGDVVVYHTHTPFTSTTNDRPANVSPVFTGGGGTGLESGDGNRRFVSYEHGLGRNPGMTTCTSCQQQVMTNVTYKPGMYAWLMCLLFICCGLVLCCCLIPFFLKNFKDAYHTCPRCNRVLHVDKKRCCKK